MATRTGRTGITTTGIRSAAGNPIEVVRGAPGLAGRRDQVPESDAGCRPALASRPVADAPFRQHFLYL